MGLNPIGPTLQPGRGLTDPITISNAYMHIVAFNDQGPVARGIVSYSEAEDQSLPHSSDMTFLYANEKFIDFPFRESEILKAQVGTPVVLKMN